MRGSVAIILSVFVLATADKWDCADYYWRDYRGTIPHDAVPGGHDRHGDPVYIGQVYYPKYELLPGTIFPKQKIAQTTAYSLVLNSSQHVKILCSPNKEAFEWISIHSKDLHKYASHNLIPGGSEVGENLYIGRISRDNGTLVGKVFRHGRVGGNGLWYPYNNRPVGTLTYEILSYNCENVMKTY